VINKSIYLSVIIPAYNEERRMKDTLLKINDYLSSQEFSSEVVIVNDGSADNTLKVTKETLKNTSLTSHILSRKRNRGKGYSVKEGVLQANGEFILFSDADLSTPL
jgi:dolichyl-phosphate beta-glucosyltransferase